MVRAVRSAAFVVLALAASSALAGEPPPGHGLYGPVERAWIVPPASVGADERRPIATDWSRPRVVTPRRTRATIVHDRPHPYWIEQLRPGRVATWPWE